LSTLIVRPSSIFTIMTFFKNSLLAMNTLSPHIFRGRGGPQKCHHAHIHCRFLHVFASLRYRDPSRTTIGVKALVTYPPDKRKLFLHLHCSCWWLGTDMPSSAVFCAVLFDLSSRYSTPPPTPPLRSTCPTDNFLYQLPQWLATDVADVVAMQMVVRAFERPHTHS
jgi:hypothetical protein